MAVFWIPLLKPGGNFTNNHRGGSDYRVGPRPVIYATVLYVESIHIQIKHILVQMSNSEIHHTLFTVPTTQGGRRYKLPGGPEGDPGPKCGGYSAL